MTWVFYKKKKIIPYSDFPNYHGIPVFRCWSSYDLLAFHLHHTNLHLRRSQNTVQLPSFLWAMSWMLTQKREKTRKFSFVAFPWALRGQFSLYHLTLLGPEAASQVLCTLCPGSAPSAQPLLPLPRLCTLCPGLKASYSDAYLSVLENFILLFTSEDLMCPFNIHLYIIKYFY